MSKVLEERSGFQCELCSSTQNLDAFQIAPSDGSDEKSIYICGTCKEQIQTRELDPVHFNCLNESMWSEVPAVVVMSYRILNALGRQDLVDMMYMEDDVKIWADAQSLLVDNSDKLVCKDSNGVILSAGDTVVVIKDLDVKGTSFVAKRGTAVRNIALVPNDPTHIEGRVNGVKIQILTKYLKKS